jgi:hypothetical protein
MAETYQVEEKRKTPKRQKGFLIMYTEIEGSNDIIYQFCNNAPEAQGFIVQLLEKGIRNFRIFGETQYQIKIG